MILQLHVEKYAVTGIAQQGTAKHVRLHAKLSCEE